MSTEHDDLEVSKLKEVFKDINAKSEILVLLTDEDLEGFHSFCHGGTIKILEMIINFLDRDEITLVIFAELFSSFLKGKRNEQDLERRNERSKS